MRPQPVEQRHRFGRCPQLPEHLSSAHPAVLLALAVSMTPHPAHWDQLPSQEERCSAAALPAVQRHTSGC